MVNEELLRRIIKIKIQSIDVMIDLLPNHLQEPIQDLQKTVVKLVNEELQEVTKTRGNKETKSTLKTIQID